jgi:hypothetical protein
MAAGSWLYAPRWRQSSPASVVVSGGAWLVAGLVRSSSFPRGAANAGGVCWALWSVAAAEVLAAGSSADEVDRRAVANLGFLLREGEDLSEAGPS